jgi:D-alanyl-D-alanine dipeptidase
VPIEPRTILKNRFAAAAFLVLECAVASIAQSPSVLLPGPKPADAPAEWKVFIGDYGPDDKIVSIFEKSGHLTLCDPSLGELDLKQVGKATFFWGAYENGFLVNFTTDVSGMATQVSFKGRNLTRRKEGAAQGQVFQITPQHPVEQLRKEALAASPPAEKGEFRRADLVELGPLDASIHLDIRYATSNDFLGTPVYSQARAFLQRPAAEALLRVQQKLKPLGYGLLIHDAYRPWYVTKIFWDATPLEGKIFVADPAQGSRHNRGCAVDLTLYDLASEKPIEMPGTYDEMSPRSFPDYPGGTSLQRWHRDLLRRAMESEGFTVYEAEWWHFDYKDWKEYAISNIPFEKIELGHAPVSVH